MTNEEALNTSKMLESLIQQWGEFCEAKDKKAIKSIEKEIENLIFSISDLLASLSESTDKTQNDLCTQIENQIQHYQAAKDNVDATNLKPIETSKFEPSRTSTPSESYLPVDTSTDREMPKSAHWKDFLISILIAVIICILFAVLWTKWNTIQK